MLQTESCELNAACVRPSARWLSCRQAAFEEVGTPKKSEAADCKDGQQQHEDWMTAGDNGDSMWLSDLEVPKALQDLDHLLPPDGSEVGHGLGSPRSFFLCPEDISHDPSAGIYDDAYTTQPPAVAHSSNAPLTPFTSRPGIQFGTYISHLPLHLTRLIDAEAPSR